MKAILVIDMPNSCVDCKFEYGGYCLVNEKKLETQTQSIRDKGCPLKPVHSLKSGGKDYIIYERQFLYNNLDREIETMKKGKEIYESNISN